MTILEVIGLLTFVGVTIHQTIDVTLKVLQYIDSKQNKKDRSPQLSRLK